MKNTIALISMLVCLIAMGMPNSSSAQVDTVSLHNLDEYLSKASGNVSIYLKDWAEYNDYLIEFNDSVFEIKDLRTARFALQMATSYDEDVDTIPSIFNKYPNIRIDLELEEVPAERIYGTTIEGVSIRSIKFPENVKYIGVNYREEDVDRRFPLMRHTISDCPNLKEIKLPAKLKAFAGVNNCKALESLEIPEGTVLFSGLEGCPSVKSLKLPKSLKYSACFINCNSLTRMIFPDSVFVGEEFNNVAFNGCTSLEYVSMPKNLTQLGWYSFDELLSYNFEDGFYPFMNCKSLKSVEIPDGVESIGVCAFWGCSSLTSISIPNSVKKIASHAFANCTSLQEIILPEGLKEIGEFAFEGCSNLKKITIPSSVDTIGRGAFWACKALKNGGNPNMIIVSGRKMEYWDNDIVCNKFGIEIPTSEFASFSALKSVVIPDNVYIINAEAFYSCVSLSKVKIHDGVTFKFDESEDYDHGLPFGGCINLKTVDLGKNINNINGFGGFCYAETIVLRDDEFLDFEALWGKTSLYTIVDLDGEEKDVVIHFPAQINPNCTIYVKKDLVDKYKDHMADINKKDIRQTLNYKFLPLEEYKE